MLDGSGRVSIVVRLLVAAILLLDTMRGDAPMKRACNHKAPEWDEMSSR